MFGSVNSLSKSNS